jgi:hypothetical protein
MSLEIPTKRAEQSIMLAISVIEFDSLKSYLLHQVRENRMNMWF